MEHILIFLLLFFYNAKINVYVHKYFDEKSKTSFYSFQVCLKQKQGVIKN